MEEENNGDFIPAAGITPKIDSWEEVTNEVPRGITGQTNQATARCSSSSRPEASRVVQLERGQITGKKRSRPREEGGVL